MARPRSSCSPVSVYRLNGGLELADYLLSLNSAAIELNISVQLGDITGRLITGLLLSEGPTWLEHVQSLTGAPVRLRGHYPFAVLLVPMQPWTYALTWGNGHHLLDDELTEQGFGLLFGIRRLDASRLGLVASSALDVTARATQTSFPGGSDLSGFRLEPVGELVNRMAGAADLSGLTYGRTTGKSYRIKAGNSLWAPLAKEPRALLADLQAIGDAVDQSDEHSLLRFVAQTRPLGKNHQKLPELEHRLAAALGGDQQYGPLGLAWPAEAVRDAEQAGSFKVQSLGSWEPFGVDTNIELDDLVVRFSQLPITARLENLRTARIVACADDEGQQEAGSLISVRKWIVFETTLDHTRYCYHQGNWFRIGEGFVEQIREQVAELLTHRSNLSFPQWTPTGKPDDEHRFCEQVARQPGYLCLDRSFASTPFHSRFELCDVVGPNNELVHIKWLGRATAASHLYVQALVSTEALRDEREALVQLNEKVTALDPRRPITETPSAVVLAIAGRRWDVDQLFTLSQVALLRLDRTMRHLRATLQFADIPFTPKTHAGTKPPSDDRRTAYARRSQVHS